MCQASWISFYLFQIIKSSKQPCKTDRIRQFIGKEKEGQRGQATCLMMEQMEWANGVSNPVPSAS